MVNRVQTNLLSTLLIIVGFVGGYLYYSQFQSDTVVIESQLSPRDDLAELENLNLDFSLFDNPAFTSLEVLGQSPVEPGPAGKRDIFGPIAR